MCTPLINMVQGSPLPLIHVQIIPLRHSAFSLIRLWPLTTSLLDKRFPREFNSTRPSPNSSPHGWGHKASSKTTAVHFFPWPKSICVTLYIKT
jgi:hypothetical protein